MNIDMVFTYCNGNDPQFQMEKQSYFKDEFQINNPIIRHATIDEIKYSVKSVLKFIPWINKIYIITYKQQPPIQPHPKIQIIDHSQIIPQQYLPTFNSDVIESFMHNIPNLSEIFLYNNDDVMHTNYVDIADIVRDNKIIYRNTFREPTRIDSEYSYRLHLTSQILRQKDPNMQLINNHQTKILRKSTLKWIEKKYPKLLHDIRINRFRGKNYIQYLFFCINIDNILFQNIIIQKCNDMLHIGCEQEYHDGIFLKVIQKRPKFLCINDMSESYKKPFERLMEYILA